VDDIKARNPETLANTTFILLRGESGSTDGIDPRPFPIIQGTQIGPNAFLPAQPSNRNYTMYEWTPLTAGHAYSRAVTFNTVDGTAADAKEYMIGGFVEPYATNGQGGGPAVGLPVGEASGILSVPGTVSACDWALASGTSSWAIGTAVAAANNIITLSLGELRYWSPSDDAPVAESAVFATGDGAGVSNVDFISLLQRNVSTIVVSNSPGTPLQNSTHWNPATMPLLINSMDSFFSPWFGHIPEDFNAVLLASLDVYGAQVFEYDEWLPLVVAMQTAQASGDGIVVLMNHTTVSNPKYGIEGGRTVTVLWHYLGRALNWEAQLTAEMKELVVPTTDPYNQANTIDHGPFKGFPHFPTTLAYENIRQSNLLSNFEGWIVQQNEELFKQALGLSHVVDDDASARGGGDDDNDDFVNSTLGVIVFVVIGVLVVTLVGLLIAWKMVGKKSTGEHSEGLLDAA
jgi:hypothetical protein